MRDTPSHSQCSCVASLARHSMWMKRFRGSKAWCEACSVSRREAQLPFDYPTINKVYYHYSISVRSFSTIIGQITCPNVKTDLLARHRRTLYQSTDMMLIHNFNRPRMCLSLIPEDSVHFRNAQILHLCCRECLDASIFCSIGRERHSVSHVICNGKAFRTFRISRRSRPAFLLE